MMTDFWGRMLRECAVALLIVAILAALPIHVAWLLALCCYLYGRSVRSTPTAAARPPLPAAPPTAARNS
jgi:hypothetical protein